MKRLVPKHCIPHSIELDGRGHAEVRYRCVRDGWMETGQYSYPGGGNYPSKRVKARSVNLPGGTVTGKARIGFVLSPDYVECHKSGSEISCRVVHRR